MSADDGHVTEGAYVFVVGGTAMADLWGKPVTAVTGWFDALARWLGTLGAVALMGTLTTSLVFWRRRLPHVPPPVRSSMACGAAAHRQPYPVRQTQRLPVEGVDGRGLDSHV
jgi:hypothetical protein